MATLNEDLERLAGTLQAENLTAEVVTGRYVKVPVPGAAKDDTHLAYKPELTPTGLVWRVAITDPAGDLVPVATVAEQHIAPRLHQMFETLYNGSPIG